MDNEILQEIIYLITKQACFDIVNYDLNNKYNINQKVSNHNYVSLQDYESAKLFLENQAWISDSTIDKVIKHYREKREKKINEKIIKRASKNQE